MAQNVGDGRPGAAWLFGPRADVLLFPGTALASALAVVGLHAAGVQGDVPLPVWVASVLAIDVAHVWASLYRVYLDGEELQRRPFLYGALPLGVLAAGLVAHAVSADFFWRALAYVAVWHFIRQQVGFMRLYGRRAGDGPDTLRLDAAAVYAATLGPVVWWHAHLPRGFAWFREGDFVEGLPAAAGDFALAVHALVLLGWMGAALRRGWREGAWQPGKWGLLLATWVAWYGGIVLARDDVAFTVMNVALHGVPYLALVHRYARGRAADAAPGYSLARRVLAAGVPAFLASLLLLAVAEEWLWDVLVWHERGALFGPGLAIDEGWLKVVVPVLTIPQGTHYILDALVWRTGRQEAAQALPTRLGWATPARSAGVAGDSRAAQHP